MRAYIISDIIISTQKEEEMSGLSNERHPLYWFDIRLVYTTHALDRLEERGIDRVDYLPPRATFVKNRKSKFEHGYLFKYQQDKKDVCIVISSSGVVLTVYWDTASANYANFGTIKNKKGFEYQINLDKYPHRILDTWTYM